MSRASTDPRWSTSSAGHFLGVLYMDRAARRPSPNSIGKFWTRWPLDAASVLENARLVETERERQRLERKSTSPAISSKRPAQKFSHYPHLAVQRQSISLASPSAEITSSIFRSAQIALRSSSPMSPAKASAPRYDQHAARRAFSDVARQRSRSRLQSHQSLSLRPRANRAVTPRCFSAFSTSWPSRIHQCWPSLAFADPRSIGGSRLPRRLLPVGLVPEAEYATSDNNSNRAIRSCSSAMVSPKRWIPIRRNMASSA